MRLRLLTLRGRLLIQLYALACEALRVRAPEGYALSTYVSPEGAVCVSTIPEDCS